jgi:dihydroflavonol-4-reductase
MPRSRRIVSMGARFVEQLASHVGMPARVDPVSVEMAQAFWYLDSSKAERELGWSPREPNLTLHDTVADLRSRGVVWPLDSGPAAYA